MTALCPSCKKTFVFGDERFGERASVRVKCPACGGVVTLEKPVAATPPKPPAAAPPGAAKPSAGPPAGQPPKSAKPRAPGPGSAAAAAGPAGAMKPSAAQSGAGSSTTGLRAAAERDGPPTVKVRKPEALEGLLVDDHVPPMPKDRRVSVALLSGPDTGKVLPCGTSRAVIGRAGSDLPIQDEEISRRHAIIETRDDRYFLKDLGSTNGTFVDERRVTETEIFDKSEFRVGNTHCMLIVTPVDDV